HLKNSVLCTDVFSPVTPHHDGIPGETALHGDSSSFAWNARSMGSHGEDQGVRLCLPGTHLLPPTDRRCGSNRGASVSPRSTESRALAPIQVDGEPGKQPGSVALAPRMRSRAPPRPRALRR